MTSIRLHPARRATFLDGSHERAADAAAAACRVDHERRDPAPRRRVVRDRDERHGRDADGRVVRVGGDEHRGAGVVDEVVEPAREAVGRVRVAELGEQARDRGRVAGQRLSHPHGTIARPLTRSPAATSASTRETAARVETSTSAAATRVRPPVAVMTSATSPASSASAADTGPAGARRGVSGAALCTPPVPRPLTG